MPKDIKLKFKLSGIIKCLISIKKIISTLLKKFNSYKEFRLIKSNVDVDPYN